IKLCIQRTRIALLRQFREPPQQEFRPPHSVGTNQCSCPRANLFYPRELVTWSTSLQNKAGPLTRPRPSFPGRIRDQRPFPQIQSENASGLKPCGLPSTTEGLFMLHQTRWFAKDQPVVALFRAVFQVYRSPYPFGSFLRHRLPQFSGGSTLR